MSQKKKKKKKKEIGADWPKFCILGEILVNILIESLIRPFENMIKFLYVQMGNPP